MDELKQVSRIAVAGMKAQAERLRVISQNLANVDSVGQSPGETPYRRKLITFEDAMDRELGARSVHVRSVTEDMAPFPKRLDPSHPAADADGYVLMPNVNPLVEMMDMREAQRSYEANMSAISVAREMSKRTLDMLR
ncbi:flagellar basal body rod protein FlgC [Roseospira marina]|uniref:Flagellar basal-body rod protein FlgC n=1 Tax=Roseospira marina TaxID=140057 RepID=A0A5M6IA04_9PROT|nr:flagellar basal body rod protein FlgC [Roseospira marina]KAA5604508.1 flagellar basal body rod protein FlgC [Roseospira marina]MBB4315565.1 flagellar basal-body rod protein FlgC [Roseospira marina]MBB5088498.1 flagellar basal-body rod protein FlgC [Roseospira marina]